MSYWFWIIVIYSFWGYLLEKGFAFVVGSPRQTRKCQFFPLCPVYGLAMAAVLLLPPEFTATVPRLIVFGGAAATGVEYLLHLFYDRVLSVRFWDYSHVIGNLRGRICLPFSLIWGVLVAVAVYFVQPTVVVLIAAIAPAVSYFALLLLTADVVLSVAVLQQTEDVDALRLPRFFSAVHRLP
jgi:uncharacterized membrane protein